MKLTHGAHLAYCTNIHRGEDWAQTWDSLRRYTLRVRDQVAPGQPFAIGLRLGDRAARELSAPGALAAFQEWLARENCYVFTINGFPYGQFHGRRVKEQVYLPDWTTPERLEYTQRLFDILVELVPPGIQGSVSTVPGSYKEFIRTDAQRAAIRANVWRCVDHLSALSESRGKILHLGLEPEPLCFLETIDESVAFFEQMQADRPGDDRWKTHLGLNYDTCHLAVEFEDPAQAIGQLIRSSIRLSKIHLSSALRVSPTPAVRQALAAYADDVYYHQVIARRPEGGIRRYRDLDEALGAATREPALAEAEWRIHFHIPLHCRPTPLFDNTTDHLLAILDALQRQPDLCAHLEMETYTWEVMPPELKNRSVVAQLVSEYQWSLGELARRGFTAQPPR